MGPTKETEDLRRELLELCFDCHPDPEPLRARIEREPAVRALWDEAQRLAAVLGEAARDEPPPLPAFAASSPKATRSPMRWFAAAAALLIAASAGTWGVLRWSHQRALERECYVWVGGPRTLPSGAPAHLNVVARAPNGSPVAATVTWSELDGEGRVAASGEVRTSASGLPAPLVIPAVKLALAPARRFELAVQADGRTAQKLAFEIPVASMPIAHVTSDKPVYRPGELVRMRATLLDRLTLAPRQDACRLRMVPPVGAGQDQWVQADEHGVIAAELGLPAQASGGNWALELRDSATNALLDRRELLVLRFEPPKLDKKLRLDRPTYAPGAKGEAEITVQRLAGGAARWAKVDASLELDGKTVWSETATLDAEGRGKLAFAVPKDVERGAARFVARVTDGGVVETEIEPFVVPTGRVEVTFYPESGTLVAGVKNRVYAEVRDPLGRPVAAKGRVIDAAGTTVCAFDTPHQGRARFDLEPASGSQYRLVLDEPKVLQYELPKPEPGLAMTATADAFAAGAPLRLRVAATEDQRYLVAAFARGVLVGQQELGGKGPHDVELALPEHVAGVLRVTAFDAFTMRPLAERLVQRKSARRLQVELAPLSRVLKPGASQSVAVKATDERGEPVRAVVGLSVSDRALCAFTGKHRLGIEDQTWLCADVEELEDVEDFVVAGEHADRNVDLLLGTRGWRRHVWAKTDEVAKLIEKEGLRAERLVAQEGLAAASPASLGSLAGRAGIAAGLAKWQDVARDATLLLLLLAAGAFAAIVVKRGVARRWPELGPAFGGVAGALALVMIVGPVVWLQAGGRGRWVEDARLGAASEGALPLAATGWGTVAPEAIYLGRSRDSAGLQVIDLNGMGAGTGLAFLQDFSVEVSMASFVSVDDRNILPNPPVLRFPPELGGGGGDGGGYASYRYVLRPKPYVHAHRVTAERRDFTETVYWNTTLVTDGGSAVATFDLSDRVTTWVASADAHGAGRVGQAEATFDTRLPLEVDAKLPVEVTAGDALEVPISLRASDTATSLATIVVDAGASLAVPEPTKDVKLVEGAGRTLLALRVPPEAAAGDLPLTIVARCGEHEDRVVKTLRVVPRGFPRTLGKSGVLAERAELEIEVPDRVLPASIAAELRLHTSPLATLVEGMEGMLQEPHGCFEQTSSTNYPNVLALQLLETLHAESAEIAADARAKLARGYERLAGFECKSHGFEWWGKDPAHEELTAYGLLQFSDMARVHPVDAAMIERTRAWLLSRRKGDGFERRDGALHSFGRAPQATMNAYLSWALAATGTPAADLAAQLAALEKDVTATKDAYELALRALALGAAGRDAKASEARAELGRRQRADGSLDGESTITASGGRDRQVETTSLAVLSWLASGQQQAETERAMEWLRGQRRGAGTFGGTQATVLALKAISAYGSKFHQAATAGELVVHVNDKRIESVRFEAGRREPIVVPGLAAHLLPGKNRIRLELTGNNRFPFTLALRCRVETQPSDESCQLSLTTELERASVEEGKTLPLRIRLRNQSDGPVSMPIAVIGLPAGLEISTKVLDDLVESKAIAQWELAGRELALYWYGLEKNAARDLLVDLVARLPGRTTGPASRAWLYYDGEARSWCEPLAVEVRPAR